MEVLRKTNKSLSPRSLEPKTQHKTHLRQDILVEVRLQLTHLDTQNPLALGWQGRQNVTLQATQHQRFELLMQFLDLFLVIGIRQVELVCQLDCLNSFQIHQKSRKLVSQSGFQRVSQVKVE